MTCHRGSVAPASYIMLKQALMLLRCLCRVTQQLLDNKLTFSSHRRVKQNVRFMCGVKKEIILPEGKAAVL